MAIHNVALAHTIAGEVVATDVSFEDYMEHYAADFHEWVRGTVIKMSPVHELHDIIGRYITRLLEAYLELKAIGLIRIAPFVMKIPERDVSREPDLQVILDDNPGELTPTAMIGPADLCVEVVSPESVERDYTEKFEEYERGGVREYWIINPLRETAFFYRLDETGNYLRYPQDEDGNYHTPTLPDLVLHVPTLWQKELPGPIAVGKAVQAMLEQAI